MLSGQAYVLGSSHGSAGWRVRGREEPGMQDSATLGMMDRLGEGKGQPPPHPEKGSPGLKAHSLCQVQASLVCVF